MHDGFSTITSSLLYIMSSKRNTEQDFLLSTNHAVCHTVINFDC
jgi:hypothetical protein